MSFLVFLQYLKKYLKLIVYGSFGIIVLVILFDGIIHFNRFTSLKVTDSCHQEDLNAELQRRNNIIKYLSILVERYLAFEEKMFKSTSEARDLLNKARVSENAKSEGLRKALPGIVALAEQYPELKGSQVVQDFMNELVESEKRIGLMKEDYNANVETYNLHRKTFPGKIYGAILGFDVLEYCGNQEEPLKVPAID
ncbi:MAG: LemA family protein [Candidatus Riflebacteria bacterium]|nr:LemA family protein [Candidatus Riflebacteria bacterium]